jgi:hypothetical protein
MSFISDQLAKHLNNHYAEIGTVEQLELGNDFLSATVRFNGDPEPADIKLAGIRWSADSGVFHLHYAAANISKPWLKGILDVLARKGGRRFSFPDKLSLMPVKMLFPKAASSE